MRARGRERQRRSYHPKRETPSSKTVLHFLHTLPAQELRKTHLVPNTSAALAKIVRHWKWVTTFDLQVCFPGSRNRIKWLQAITDATFL